MGALLLGLASGLHAGSGHEIRVRKSLLPIHPEALRKLQVTGSAEIECVVTSDGRVIDARVLGATHQEFGEVGLSAIKQWVFEPQKDLQNGSSTTVIVFHFILNHERAVETLVQRAVFRTITEPIVPMHELTGIPMPRIQLIAHYPQKLIGSGKNGRAVVSIVIGKDGRVLNPRVVKATFPELATPSLLTAIQLEFSPPRDSTGRPVYAAMEIQYSFVDPKPPLTLPWKRKKQPAEAMKARP